MFRQTRENDENLDGRERRSLVIARAVALGAIVLTGLVACGADKSELADGGSRLEAGVGGRAGTSGSGGSPGPLTGGATGSGATRTDSGTDSEPGGPADAADGAEDARPLSDGSKAPDSSIDVALDAALEAGPADAPVSSMPDRSAVDAGGLDARPGGPAESGTPVADAAASDSGAPDSAGAPPTGLSVPCENGAGWTLLSFHYEGTTTAVVDVWDASCSYSLSASSQCLVQDVGSLLVVAGGTAVSLDGSDVIRIRYSVAGIDFGRATVWVQARSYSTNATTNIELWAPLYGSRFTGPVSQEFTYFWYATDWTGFVSPLDPAGTTAIEISPSGGSNSLAVRAVEICLER